MTTVAKKVSPGFDILESLRVHLAESLYYHPRQGYTARERNVELVGDVNGVPYGDLYRDNDTFLMPGQPGEMGRVMYVGKAERGSPRLVLQEEQPHPQKHPRVVMVSGHDFGKEVDTNTVLVGIRHLPGAFVQAPQQVPELRLTSRDGYRQLVNEPFWSGGFHLHVAALDKWDGDFVFNLLNRAVDLTTRLYQLRAIFIPQRPQLMGERIADVFQYVLSGSVLAALTADTPYDALPDEVADGLVFGNDGAVSGWTGILGIPELDDAMKRHGEKAGDFDVPGVGDDLPHLFMPQSLVERSEREAE